MKTKFSKTWISSIQPRKQRKYRHNATPDVLRKFLSINLSKELREKHGVRSVKPRVGDKVKVMRGTYKSKSGAIESVDTKHTKVYVAKIELTKRTLELAKIHGFQHNEIRVKDIKTRWGSCSSRNNINLSIYLAKVPKELSDYVIIHELVHTKIKNHQKEFWLAMEHYLPGARKIDRKLKDYKTEI